MHPSTAKGISHHFFPLSPSLNKQSPGRSSRCSRDKQHNGDLGLKGRVSLPEDGGRGERLRDDPCLWWDFFIGLGNNRLGDVGIGE